MYLNFCGMSGIKALSQTKLSIKLKTRESVNSTRSKHGMVWTGIALKPEWCRVGGNPTSLALDQKGVGLSQNAQSFENSPYVRDFAHKPTYPTLHSDSNSSPIKKDVLSVEGKDEEANEQETSKQNKHSNSDEHEDRSSQKSNDPGLQKFKAGMAKRQCCLCSRTFPYDLTPYVGGGKRGYICVTCHMTGPPPEPAKADSQAKLEEGQ
jgi:hypothetical protein